MSRTVSAREAQARFGSMVKWAEEHDEGVVVQRRGKPAAAIISYTAYEELARLRRLERKLQALRTLRTLRSRVQERSSGLGAEEAYRLAGFGEEALRRLLEDEARLAELE